jgi:hypothetical protein
MFRRSASSCPTRTWIPASHPATSSSSFNFRLPAFHCFSLTPFLATLTSRLQFHENTATLSPAFVTLASQVTHNSLVCHSCKKHPWWGVRLPGWHPEQSDLRFRPSRKGSTFFRSLAISHSPLTTNVFRISTSRKSTATLLECTSKKSALKVFQIEHLQKNWAGGGTDFSLCTFEVLFLGQLKHESPLQTGRLRPWTSHEPPVTASRVPSHRIPRPRVCHIAAHSAVDPPSPVDFHPQRHAGLTRPPRRPSTRLL